MAKFSASTRLEEAAQARAKRDGVPYVPHEFDINAYKESLKIYKVEVEEFQRTYDGGFHYYNFRVQGNAVSETEKSHAFKELHKFIVNGRPNLARDLNLTEYEMKDLSEGKSVKGLSWHSEVPGKVMQLWHYVGAEQ